MSDVASAPVGQVVRVARVVGGQVEKVWAVFNDAATHPSWWGKTEKLQHVESTMDVRTGGLYRIRFRTPAGEEQTASGRFLEVSPPARLAFGWMLAVGTGAERETRVTLEFADLKDGTTRVTATHEGLPSQTAASRHLAGWHDMLQDLAIHFATAG